MAHAHTKEAKSRTMAHGEHSEHHLPKQGETYRCGGCGMEMEVVVDCNCKDPNHVKLECCGQALTRV